MVYKSCRIIDGRPKFVVVDEHGNIINKIPTQNELESLKNESYKRNSKTYKDQDLLNYLKQFVKDNGRIPVCKDFLDNPEYPNIKTYHRRFGGWQDALKLVGLDVETLAKRGILMTNQQKSRLAEIIVRDHFEKNPKDLAGNNYKSPCDGICPNGKTYDVKSSRFRDERKNWHFHNYNKYKEKIEIYYLLAFDENYKKIRYGWRIPGWKIIDKDDFYVGLHSDYEFNVENMKVYDITDKIVDLLDNLK